MDTLTRIKEAEALLAELREKYEQEQKMMPWKPKNGDKFWYCDVEGVVGYDYFETICENSFKQGNLFRTEAEAKATVELRAVVHELKQCEGFRPFVQGEVNFGFRLANNRFDREFAQTTCFSWQGCYYETAEQRDAAIAKIGDDRILKAMMYSECGVV